jgi:hypothetical protein
MPSGAIRSFHGMGRPLDVSVQVCVTNSLGDATGCNHPADLVERLQNKTSAVLQNKTSDVPSGNLGTSYQTPSVPSLAPSHTESAPTRFTLPIQPAFSDGESEDSMPDIVDAAPDSVYDY